MTAANVLKFMKEKEVEFVDLRCHVPSSPKTCVLTMLNSHPPTLSRRSSTRTRRNSSSSPRPSRGAPRRCLTPAEVRPGPSRPSRDPADAPRKN